ncbi:MAG: GNAT family N-acetyltransferase [Ignavibacteriaceae bacterium]|nr:GNAT family N-acetyltransferase [Ignavibacteriaceae bacterium]
MQNKNYVIRTMTRDEINIAVEWAALEGWNPGLYDADCFYAADPNGFLIGLVDGEPIAVISVIKYDSNFGFLGFYIIKPEYRRMGYGIKIWNAGLKYLQGCNIGLDGVVAQQDNYKKSGFNLAYRNIRFEGISRRLSEKLPDVFELSSVPFQKIEEYDKRFFPAARNNFLKRWLNQPESKSFGVLTNGKLKGYGMIRVCRNGYKIGPLFADTPEIAENIFLTLSANVNAGQPLFLDTPETNPNAVNLAKKYDMKIVFETARMYTGEFPDISLERLYGVTTFELG